MICFLDTSLFTRTQVLLEVSMHFATCTSIVVSIVTNQ